ncbi:helix-turn-helix domain-containing protein [Azonexus caeni]|uniref:helix-turn-helix domain-containing protein n=1 Tax=Azonexus caeni TaxID=266126 RepID=UPI003A8C198F
MLTELGKVLRKLRIDLGETLVQMAEQLDMSATMLSAIETGKKKVPAGFINRLTMVYPKLTGQRASLESLANLANGEAKVSLDDASTEDAELVTELARRFADLSNEEKMQLRQLLRQRATSHDAK